MSPFAAGFFCQLKEALLFLIFSRFTLSWINIGLYQMLFCVIKIKWFFPLHILQIGLNRNFPHSVESMTFVWLQLNLPSNLILQCVYYVARQTCLWYKWTLNGKLHWIGGNCNWTLNTWKGSHSFGFSWVCNSYNEACHLGGAWKLLCLQS